MVNVSRQLARFNKPRTEVPHIFGRGGRDRVLVCLAVNGPMTVREIGRAIGSDSHKTYNMVEYLLTSGLVVKRNMAGGRKYVALNRKLPVYRRLVRLLFALDKAHPATRVSQPRYRWRMWKMSGAITRSRLDAMFFSPIRSRILLYVAAVGITDMRSMYNMLGIGDVSALYAVNHWEREGIMRTERVGQHRLVRLDERHYAATELRSLLEGLIVNNNDLRGYRKVGRLQMRPILKRLSNKKHYK